MSEPGAPLGTFLGAVREGPSRYRIGDYTAHLESPGLWRIFWIPKDHEFAVRSGVMMTGHPTLREAISEIRTEIANEEIRTPMTKDQDDE